MTYLQEILQGEARQQSDVGPHWTVRGWDW